MVSPGVIPMILANGAMDPNLTPVLQVMSIRPVATGGAGAQRFRMVLTDGTTSAPAMLASQLNGHIQSGKLQDYTMIRLDKYMTNDLNNQKVLVILDLTVVGQETGPIGGGAATMPATMPNQAVAAQQTNYGQAQVNPYAQQRAPVVQQAAPLCAPMASPSPYGQSVPMQTSPAPAAPSSYGSNAYSNNAYGGNTYGSGPVVRQDSSAPILPISAINPYSNKWTIKARITNKSEIRRWSNAKGEGTLFSIDLLDSHGGEIRGTFFKDACEKFFPMLEEGKVYTFSGGTLKVVANRNYSTIKNNYELTFNVQSDIRAAQEDSSIKAQNYSFVKINSIANAEVGSTIDIIGIVKEATECTEIISKNRGGVALQKRDLTLIDESLNEVRLTIWGDKAQANTNWQVTPIVAVKGVKVGDYGGRSLSTLASSSLVINPAIPEGHMLHQWRSAYPDNNFPVQGSLSTGGPGSGGSSVDAFDKRKSILSIREESLGMSEKPDYITIKGSINYIKHDNDPWYTACPNNGCNKKVVEGMNGQFFCEKCNQNYDSCNRRFILSATMVDNTGNNWFSLFNETAEKLLGCNAQTLYELRTEGNEAGYEKYFADALFKTYVAKVRVKQEAVNDELRVKCTVANLNDLDLNSECNAIIDAISKY